MGKKPSDVVILKIEGSNQIEDKVISFNQIDGVQTPPIDFAGLEELYEKSFIVGGLLDKISSTIGSEIVTENEEILKILRETDTKFLYDSLEFFGNSFFEVIRNKSGKVVRIAPIITSTIRRLRYGGYVQQIGADKVFFNDFCGKIEDRKNKTLIWTSTGVKPDELATDKNPGYNPNLNEVFQFKKSHLFNKYYGNSLYQATVDQILLLSEIDLRFSSMFGQGWTGNSAICVDSDNPENKISAAGIKSIQETLKNGKGVKNAGINLILQTRIKKVDLSQEFNVTEFNAKTEELLKKISIGLNIPFEVLLSIAGNKATSEQAEENFYIQKIVPLQAIIIAGFTEIFMEDYKPKDLYFKAKDYKNGKDEMERITGYVKSKVIKQNEARAEIGYAPVDGGDTFLDIKSDPTTSSNTTQNPADVKKIVDQDVSFLKSINEHLSNNF